MAADRSPTLAELSEGDVLARVLARFERGGVAGSETLVGPGDDSAVLRAPDGRFVVTTDMMVHGPDFRLAWSTPDDLGWKAAASNLADIAAMGARPTGLVVALAAPQTFGIDVVEGIARGLAAGCAAMAPGCGVVGGDLSASATLTLSITAFGSLDGRPPVLRSGAQPGDVLATAGPLGRAGLGLRLLFEQAREEGEPSAALAARLRQHFPALLDAQLRPTAPIAQGIAAGGIATAMMDVSDGVVLDARRMARASGVTIDLDPAAVDAHARELLRALRGGDRDAAKLAPTRPEGLAGLDEARALVLGGGEDHAMLASFPAEVELPDGFHPLGSVQKGVAEVRLGGVALEDRGGWDPYLGWDGGAG